MSEHFSSHNESVIASGKEYELLFVEPIECGWDEEEYFRLKDLNPEEAVQKIHTWVEDHIMPMTEWRKLRPEEKREKTFEWVEAHQPNDWDPKDPPIRNNLESHFIPPTFMQDLHYAVSEGLASAFISHQKNSEQGNTAMKPQFIPQGAIDDYLEESNLSNFLEACTAIGTPVDTLYGTDFFFKFEFTDGATNEPHHVFYSIDITKNPMKIKNQLRSKANVDYVLWFQLIDKDGNIRDHITPEEIRDKGREIGYSIFKQMEATLNKQHRFYAA